MGVECSNYKVDLGLDLLCVWCWCWKCLFWLLVLFVVIMVLQVVLLCFLDLLVFMVMMWCYGEVLGQCDWDYCLYYQWCDLDQMVLSLLIFLVVVEDQCFFVYNGFDLQVIEKVCDYNVCGGWLWGVSMISQQVVKNLFLWQGCSWVCKGLEVWYMLLIEVFWLKLWILEMYVNIVEFGDGIYGVQVVLWQFWNKDVVWLSLVESVWLVVVLFVFWCYNVVCFGFYVQ